MAKNNSEIMLTPTDKFEPEVVLVSWDQIGSVVKSANKQLYSYLDQILTRPTPAGKKTWHLIKVRYPYGSLIAKKGIFLKPNVSDHSIKVAVEAIDWSNDPIGLILSNSAEIFRNHEGEISLEQKVPFNIPEKEVYNRVNIVLRHVLQEGDLFGAFEVATTIASSALQKKIDNDRDFDISAGARSVHLVLPLGNIKFYDTLPNYIDPAVDASWYAKYPHLFSWDIVRTIAQYTRWFTEVLFIPNECFNGFSDNSKALREFLQSFAWDQSYYLRHHPIAFERLHAPFNTIDQETKGKSSIISLFEPMWMLLLLRLEDAAAGRYPLFWAASLDSATNAIDNRIGPFNEVLKILIEKDPHKDRDKKVIRDDFKPATTQYQPYILFPDYLGVSKGRPRGLLSLSMPSCGNPLRHRRLKTIQNEWEGLLSAFEDFFCVLKRDKQMWKQVLPNLLDWNIDVRRKRNPGGKSDNNWKPSAKEKDVESLPIQDMMKALNTPQSSRTFYAGHPFFQAVITLEHPTKATFRDHV